MAILRKLWASSMRIFRLMISIVLIFYLALAVTARCEEKSTLFWRTAQNEGVNVLYCFLRIHDVSCKYPDLVDEKNNITEARSFSANTMVQLAGQHGIRLTVLKQNMDELERGPKPSIVYMLEDTPDDGAFLLLLGMNDKNVYYMAGESGTIESMSRVDFRRAWSGIVLLPDDQLVRRFSLFFIGLFAGLIALYVRRWVISKNGTNKDFRT